VIESFRIRSSATVCCDPIARRALPLAFVLGIGLALGACSTMADVGEATSNGVSAVASAMNPANWFKDDETDAEARAKQNRAVANTSPKSGVKSASRDGMAQRASAHDEERYPKLSSVPERPREPTSRRAEKEREELREGLVADTANAQYTDSQLRARTAGAIPSATADSVRSNERISGEPTAMAAPTAPVTASPVAIVPPAASPAAAPAQPASQKQVASATPEITPPPIARSSAPQRTPFGAKQAAAAAAAPVTAVSPSAPATASTPKPQQQAALSRPEGRTVARPADPAPRSVLKTVQVATIYFNDGSSRLSANDRRVVDEVAEAARRTGGLLRIIGHSSMSAGGRDTEEAALVNYRVSLARANAVAVELLRHGIPGNQMQVMAEGARNPIYSERSATGAAGNRRTEIYLDYYERL